MTGLLPYWGILIAAIIEGEIAYIGAAALVAQGQLNPFLVLVSGAIGAAIGDQAFFYVFRGRLSRWVAKYPSLERKTAPLLRARQTQRFADGVVDPLRAGLRIAIAAACAWVESIPAEVFRCWNLLSSFVWAIALLILVGWLGPTPLAVRPGRLEGAALVGLVILGLFKLLGTFEQRTLESED